MKNIYSLKEIDWLKDWLIAHQATIAVAESVTSGHLQGALSQAEDARRFFQGGLTAYNIGQKCRLLNIEPIHALENDGVSGQVAEQMATQVASVFCSNFGVGITGYAAPVPEKGITTPFAFYSISNRNDILRTARLEARMEEALAIQLDYVNRIMVAIKEVLTGLA